MTQPCLATLSTGPIHFITNSDIFSLKFWFPSRAETDVRSHPFVFIQLFSFRLRLFTETSSSPGRNGQDTSSQAPSMSVSITSSMTLGSTASLEGFGGHAATPKVKHDNRNDNRINRNYISSIESPIYPRPGDTVLPGANDEGA